MCLRGHAEEDALLDRGDFGGVWRVWAVSMKLLATDAGTSSWSECQGVGVGCGERRPQLGLKKSLIHRVQSPFT